jgi:hypothetical protein
VLVVTGTRADFGKQKGLMKAIESAEDFSLQVVVTGMHLIERYGETVQEVLDQGYLAQRVADPAQLSEQLSGGIMPFKVDVRVWTHGNEPVFAAARLYAGQVMGFRSEGAGFAPILWVDPDRGVGACHDVEGFRALCSANMQAPS